MTRLGLMIKGRDRPGFVRDVCQVLLDLGWNLEGCQGANSDGEFRMLALAYKTDARGHADVVARFEESLPNIEVEPFVPTSLLPRRGAPRTRIVVVGGGRDEKGVVAKVAQVLTSHGANIEALFSQQQLPNRRTYHMTMIATCAVKKRDDIERDLNRLAEDLGDHKFTVGVDER